jgi:NAD-dependent dihydropyrimidine dehydrogenase PreA subunit
MGYNGPWFPTIYSDKCDGCAKTGKPRCVEFCPNGVFEFKDEKAIVAFPAKCGGDCATVRCSACAPLCHKKAIVFPLSSSSLGQAKEDKGMVRKTTCRICGKKYLTNREKDICFDCDK